MALLSSNHPPRILPLPTEVTPWTFALNPSPSPLSLYLSLQPSPPPPLQYAQLLQIAADHAQTLVTRNIRYDHVVDILFNSYDDNATAVSYDTVGDAATWTGHFLALHAFKSAASNGVEL